MNVRPKRVPRLWCALQGLLPLDPCLGAQRAELVWPPDASPATQPKITPPKKEITLPRPTRA